jgi:hypothetical protein
MFIVVSNTGIWSFDNWTDAIRFQDDLREHRDSPMTALKSRNRARHRRGR